MGLGLLLAPALAGYLFLTAFNGTRYSLPRETGYHVVFQSAIVGVLLFVLARFAVVLANAVAPAVAECWNAIVPIDYSGTAAGTFVLAAIVALFLNRVPRYDRLRARQRSRRGGGRPSQPGYRDNESRDLVVTTNYAPAIEARLADRALDDLKVAFPMRDVASARLFDQELYASFLDARTAAASSRAGGRPDGR